MKTLATLFSAIVALLHLGFLTLEMFLWKHPIGRKVFDTSESFANETSFMAQNQGLYNGFLAAGLIWGLAAKKRDVTVFFLICVIVAGVFGAITVSPSIFIVQAIPAILALIFTALAKKKN